MRWREVCRWEALRPELGAPVLVDGHLIALFRTEDGELYALGNVDPVSSASVMSRGIVGDRAGEPVVASPMHKQVFSLRSGRCLDVTHPELALPTYAVRRQGDVVEIGLP
ncbi:nitrite reductase (NAD(P)H) small subunit [Actinoalloteichus sp. AHMU CJ021]|uniref:Nitrite reductase (NADH) small subunit n=1 Tax=Actinoalloteichus caeruleus DSM 43889 TaxID=1120930 RepID=A0ABT1JP19_ACTCY|nr:nitrite reductase small subunit NirD [Actinoalloteichus caeruleus]AUS79915.1 nitrite reductase (NAD(P)H) small subunit [Actinoalloteichus sp. AHMU CJ021]MCP2334097.1 nitrite reductase (NADH) small subunit [Actinoalloteichus caeruleus DSM 43889]